MTRKQLALLFLGSFLPYIVGSAFMSVIVLYAGQLGVGEAGIGIYLAISFAVLAISTLISGSLSTRFQRRRLFIILAAVASAPLVYLIGHARTIVELTALTSMLWFLFGIISTMVSILMGMYADQRRRGQNYSVLGSGLALGQVVGGLSAGQIVDGFGWGSLFTSMAGIYILLAVVALFLEDDQRLLRSQFSSPIKEAQSTASYQRIVWLLIAANLLGYIVINANTMGRPLVMEAQHFSTTAITSIVAIGGLMNLPLTFLMGWLSDHIGRRFALMVCYALAGVGISMLIPAQHLWHFGLAQILLNLVNTGLMVGSAMVTDITPPEQLSSALSRYTSTHWFGAVLGFVGAGFSIQYFGLAMTFAIAVTLAATATAAVWLTLPHRDKLATQITSVVRATDA